MNCPTCGGPMRPLFTSEFCPNDCDRNPRGSRLIDDRTFEVLKRRWGSFIYAPRVPLVVNNLIAVEPMPLPKGLLFYMDIERK